MATLATGNVSGGVKKASGVQIPATVGSAWARVRDNTDASTNWICIGYTAGSKTAVDVVATGSGVGISHLRDEAGRTQYDDQCLFGGFRDVDDRFVHFMYVGKNSGAMARGRASLHKNAVLNELEGCVREESIVAGESDAQTTAPGSAELPAPNDTGVIAVAPVVEAPSAQPGAVKFEALSDSEFESTFAMSRTEFLRLPEWKRTSARKSKGLF